MSNTQAIAQSPALLPGCSVAKVPSTNISLIAWIPNVLINCMIIIRLSPMRCSLFVRHVLRSYHVQIRSPCSSHEWVWTVDGFARGQKHLADHGFVRERWCDVFRDGLPYAVYLCIFSFLCLILFNSLSAVVVLLNIIFIVVMAGRPLNQMGTAYVSNLSQLGVSSKRVTWNSE